MEVARYLGRLKELMDGKRKNGYAYGRGEKYSLELGGDINRAIARSSPCLPRRRRCRFSCASSSERHSSSTSAGSPSAREAATSSVCWTSPVLRRAKHLV